MSKQGFEVIHATNPKQILFMTNPYAAVGVVVSDTNVTADSDGRKIIKAGTPLMGDLTARETPFKKVETGGEANVMGVAVHDVDVTDGNENAELLILGYVNLNNLEQDVVDLITDSVKDALKAKVTFLK